MTGSLDYLLGNYFHQDLFEVHGDEWAAIEAFVRDDPHRTTGVLADIQTVLSTYPTEADLEAYVVTTGCEYVPAGGYRGWLMEVARRVRAANSQT